MNEYYPISGSQMHDCNKKDCFYCYATKRETELHAVKDEFTKMLQRKAWSDKEIELITRDWNIVPSITGRTRKQVLEKRWRLSVELGVKVQKLVPIRNKKEVKMPVLRQSNESNY